MPTAKPRVTITLEPGTHRLLASLAYHQHTSISAIVNELISTAHESLERLDMVLEHAAGAPAELLMEMEKAFNSFESQLNLLEEDDGGSGSRSGAPPSSGLAPRPPTSNRGVRNTPEKSSKSMLARPTAKLKESRK